MPNTAVLAAGGALPTAQPTIFLAVTPTMRLRIATTIENLIALLDEIDGDENLEDGGDLECSTMPKPGLPIMTLCTRCSHADPPRNAHKHARARSGRRNPCGRHRLFNADRLG